MKLTTTTTLATLAVVASAAKDETTFAVLRFDGDGFLTEGPMDPIANPGVQSTHYHSIMGGSNFGATVEGDYLLDSNCTTAKIKNDKSNYWIPQVFFHDPQTGAFEKVKLFYMNVYYFFEASDRDVEAFPPGLKVLVGDVNTRSPPEAGGAIQLDPDNGPVNSIQWTCPRSSYDPASYPADSDGSTAGIQDPNNKGAGAGFPLYPCDGYASPLRQDLHFPSCYNPEAGLDDHKNNMAFPSNKDGKLICPEGWTHVPHLFYEVYWNTPEFDDRWTPDGKSQPFVLSNGDVTGFSSHADFIAGWDPETLQTIIDTCDAGTIGMDNCPQIPGGLNDNKDCKIEPSFGSILRVAQTLDSLPLGNKLTGWGQGGVTGGSVEPDEPSTNAPADPAPAPAPSVSSIVSEAGSAPTAALPIPSLGGGVFKEEPSEVAPAPAPTEVEVQELPVLDPPVAVVTPAPAATVVPVDPDMSTVWEIVTVTATTTVAAPEASAVRRRVPRNSHGHLGRHVHGSGLAGHI